MPAKTINEPASRPRDTRSASTRPASRLAKTIEDDRTASTGAAAPRRRARSPNANDPRFATAATVTFQPSSRLIAVQPTSGAIDETGPARTSTKR